MSFDFDRVVNRRNTHSTKWDKIKALSGIDAADALPLWVADMDFPAPPGVTAALREEIDRGTHGYYADTGSWSQSLCDWMSKRHKLKIDPAWVSVAPGIVSGLGLILQAVSEPGDDIVVFPPAYHAFRKIIDANNRAINDVPLVLEQGRYRMDFDLLRAKIGKRTKAVFFCSPHNPGGTCWSADEIKTLAEICKERGVILVSDEIHCDLLFSGATHVPTLNAAPHCADHIITCVAATKTFNLAGAHVGALVTTNPALKKKLDAAINASGLASYNSFGMIATEAGWRTGEAWLGALLPYLEKNRDHAHARIERAVPGARAMKLDSTYLAWIDFSACSIPAREVAERVAKRARLFVSPGEQFGPGGGTWLRINFATPRPILDDALARIDDAFADLR
jgi:cysteine-S-conjugate beta-lyase